MSVSFVGSPIAVKLKAVEGEGFIRTEGEEEDYVFDLYAVEGQSALILNEHELVWVELDRVCVLLAEEKERPD